MSSKPNLHAPFNQNIPLKTNPWNPPHKTKPKNEYLERFPCLISIILPFLLCPSKHPQYQILPFSIIKPFYKKQ